MSRALLLAFALAMTSTPPPAAVRGSGPSGTATSSPTPSDTGADRYGSFLFGVAYYPEQWPESYWEADARRMQEAGVKVVRLAEFAWYLMEPRQGNLRLQPLRPRHRGAGPARDQDHPRHTRSSSGPT